MNYFKEFKKGIWKDNPVMVQLLGMCPTLAVTNSATNGLAMGLATIFVILSSAIFVATLRKIIPHQVRIASYIVIIATFVTIADYTLAALFPVISKALGPYVPLIVVNCLILGRMESFASKNPVPISVTDAFGFGAGFTWALVLLGGVREVLGNGTLFGFRVLGDFWEPWIVMVLPGGAFLALGIMIGIMRHFTQKPFIMGVQMEKMIGYRQNNKLIGSPAIFQPETGLGHKIAEEKKEKERQEKEKKKAKAKATPKDKAKEKPVAKPKAEEKSEDKSEGKDAAETPEPAA